MRDVIASILLTEIHCKKIVHPYGLDGEERKSLRVKIGFVKTAVVLWAMNIRLSALYVATRLGTGYIRSIQIIATKSVAITLLKIVCSTPF